VDIVLDGCNGAAGADLHEEDGCAEHDAVHHRRAYTHSRAHGKGQSEDGIFSQNPIKEQLRVCFF